MFRKLTVISILIVFLGLIAFTFVDVQKAENSNSPNRNVLIVVDGLHPGYVTPELMPNLYKLSEQGVFGDMHSAAFPSVTRVNSPSISTGSYPVRHGIMHNAMWLAEMGDEPFSTGNANQLSRLDELSGGELLTTVSVGEVMEEAGFNFFACGSGGGGNTLLQNHRGKGKGIWTTGAGGFFIPETDKETALASIGEVPDNRPEATVWAFDAYLHHALGSTPPDFTMMWINEPDAAGHSYGVGSPEVLDAIANVDEQIGRILKTHKENGLTDKVNLFVTADHGFSTNTGNFNVSRTLEQAGVDESDAKVVNNMVYLADDSPQLLNSVVEALQRDSETGAIYTRPAESGSSEGIVQGTLSTGIIQWDHKRSADVLISPAWSDDKNEFGFEGTNTRSGTATHGSDSPYDLRIPLVASGPDIKNGLRSEVPTGNVDFIPTVLHLLGITPPEEMDGRVLFEILQEGSDPENVDVQEQIYRSEVTFPDGFDYRTELHTLQVDHTVYFKRAQTEKSKWE